MVIPANNPKYTKQVNSAKNNRNVTDPVHPDQMDQYGSVHPRLLPRGNLTYLQCGTPQL